MGVTRRIIFPAIRIVLWAVIAAALVKIAFAGADLSTQDNSLQPTGAVVEPTVEAVSGTVVNAVAVQGSVVADPAVVVRATLAGNVSRLLAADGATVAAGDPVLEIRQETPQEPLVQTNPETGEQTVTERRPKVVVEKVLAPAAGVLTVPTLKDQVVSVGDTVGSVLPGTLSVTGTLTPDQQYRLIGAPTEAEVTLKGGPAPFQCTGLRVGAAALPPGTTQDPTTPASSGTVACAIPAGITAFPGLGADLAITNGTAQDVVVVPVTAVQGTVQTGNIWVVTGDAEPEQRSVSLGLTDGENVQVTEGVALGDTILQFVPVPDAGETNCDDPAQYDPMVCGG